MRDWKAEARELVHKFVPDKITYIGSDENGNFINMTEAIAALCEKAYNDGYGAAMLRRADCCERYRAALQNIIDNCQERINDAETAAEDAESIALAALKEDGI